MVNEETVTITEITPDGTETVIEITTAADDGSVTDADNYSSEDVIEAFFDDNAAADDSLAENNIDNTGFANAEGDYAMQNGGADFAGETDNLYAAPFDVQENPLTENASAPTTETGGADYSAANETATDGDPEQQAHYQAAVDAQQAADQFVASGDYAAAAQSRETAENESWAAGDDSMLSAYDSSDLSYAAEKQEDAANYDQQETAHARQGDYEAARDDANNAAYANSYADSSAGGDDHTGQADAEKQEMDWAVSEEKQADYNAQNADAYAADGDFNNAETYAAAADHQTAADHYGDLGEHGSEMAVHDSSSEVETGGSYDSSYDSHLADTTADVGYNSGTDDV